MYPTLFISSHPEALENYISANHFDVFDRYQIVPAKTTLSIGEVRDLKKQLAIKPRKKRLILIYGLDAASVEVQNALLKTFEESTTDNQFLIPITQLHSILPTIQSRCQVVQHDSEISAGSITDAQLDELFKSLATPDYTTLNLSLLQQTTVEEAAAVLQAIIIYLGKKFNQGDMYIVKLAKKTLQILNLLRNNNLNPQLALDHWTIYAKRTALQMK